jgi:nitrate reductase beta subunit
VRAACPSGAIYKREEDGIVLIDQDKCRGWRMCVSACPYKKIYYNWKSGKSEKCIFCYPRIEMGQPTVCSETCVGRIRYLGVMLYDADRIAEAASVAAEKDLYQAHLDIFLDPNDPAVIAAAREGIPTAGWSGQAVAGLQDGDRLEAGAAAAPGIPHAADGLVRAAAVADPVRRRAWPRGHERRTAGRRLAAHPGALPGQPADGRRRGAGGARAGAAAGDARLRAKNVDGVEDTACWNRWAEHAQVEEMYRYLAIANYEDRFVIPTGHREYANDAFGERGGCGFTFGNGCNGDSPADLFGQRKTTTFVVDRPEPPPQGGGVMSVLKLVGVLLDYPAKSCGSTARNCSPPATTRR